MQLVVVVDVHDEEEETTGQDDGATHEEKVLVVVEDVHQQPWEEEKWAFTCVTCVSKPACCPARQTEPSFARSETSEHC